MDTNLSVSPSVYASMEEEEVVNFISNLPQKNFAPILLANIEGYSNDEIAEQLAVNEKYVRDRKHLARRKLLTLKKRLLDD